MARLRWLAGGVALPIGAACVSALSCGTKASSSSGSVPSDAGSADVTDASVVEDAGTPDRSTPPSVDAHSDAAAGNCRAAPTGPAWKLVSFTANLHAVWGSCANDVWAVGDAILHWDGRAWSVVPAPGVITPVPTTTLRTVWGAAPNHVWAAGDHCAFTQWDGHSWTLEMAGGLGFPAGDVACPNISALWGSSSTSAWALEGPSDAGSPAWLQIDDGGWHPQTPADGQAPWATPEPGFSLWGTGPDDVWAACQTQIQHWNGTTWSVPVAQPPSSPALAIWGTSDSDVWAAGATGVFHWMGTSWTRVTAPLAGVDAVWGSSTTDVWLGGSTGLVHWDGQSFGAVTATPQPVEGLWGAAANDVWAVGAQSQILHFDGSTWSRSLGSVTTADIGAIWGSSESDVWTLGGSAAGPYASHWDGTAWSPSSIPIQESVTGAWGSSSSDVWATSPSHVVHWDGTSWTDVTPSSAGPGAFVAPWGSAADDVWVATGNQALHWNGTAWSAPATLPFVTTTAIWGGGPDDVWASGETQRISMSLFAGGFAHWDGTSWQLAPWSADAGAYARTVPSNEALWGTSDGGYWANDNGWGGMSDTLHFSWSGAARSSPSLGPFYGTGANDVWALAPNGVAHFDGSSWNVMPLSGPVTALWSSGPGHAWAVGSAGTILQYGN